MTLSSSAEISEFSLEPVSDLPHESLSSVEFPSDALPGPIRKWAMATAKTTGVPLPAVAALGMSLLSAAVGPHAVGTPRGWVIPGAIWVRLNAGPEAGKRLFDEVVSPVTEGIRTRLQDVWDTERPSRKQAVFNATRAVISTESDMTASQHRRGQARPSERREFLNARDRLIAAREQVDYVPVFDVYAPSRDRVYQLLYHQDLS